jgi:hypothetical protein
MEMRAMKSELKEVSSKVDASADPEMVEILDLTLAEITSISGGIHVFGVVQFDK